MQPYLDRDLDDAQVREAEAHLDGCSYCRRRYRFEVSLRRYVRTATNEQMPRRAEGEARGAAHAASVGVVDVAGRRQVGAVHERDVERARAFVGDARPMRRARAGRDASG